ncbi:hypothetical protein LCGC14_0529100 [marine sediment metagenome]|uniref:Uncharacterized protein n=1 Tax=marine sediment metagenome TaxID=412755 RepID=A0A0F9UHJ2_9ZZZZ
MAVPQREEDASTDLEELLGKDPLNVGKLHPELKACLVDGPFGPSIQHPFVHQVFFSSWKRANEMLEHKNTQVAKAIAEKRWGQVLWLYERPWRLDMLNEMWMNKTITRHELRTLLPRIWIDAELLGKRKALLLRLFKATGFVSDDAEKPNVQDYLVPGEAVTIYRGSAPAHANGLSWTRSPQIAAWFARRLNDEKTCIVTAGEVLPEHVLGVFTGRGEDEVVVNPRHIKNRRQHRVP